MTNEMKQILIIGAGQSTSSLVTYLLEHSQEHDWFVILADRNPELAREKVAGHQRSQAIGFDVNDAAARSALIGKAQIVVNMLPRPYQHLIALECLNYNASMITASYADPLVEKLDAEAIRKGLLILNEMGVDPGIDHMVAMSIIQRVHAARGFVTSLRSYGGGLPAPESQTNPLRYAITWNPRNVLMAGEDGALYKEDGKIKLLPFYHIFQRTWTVEIEGVGTFEVYPNRDSLSYKAELGLKREQTIIRGTLRYPGWSETWQQIIHLGLANEALRIPNLKELSYRELTEMCLPQTESKRKLELRVAEYLGISPTGRIMENLRWLGLFSKESIGIDAESVADVMIHLIRQKLAMPPGGRDMVILHHEIEAVYPEENDRKESITSTLIEYGEPDGQTAIAKTVGLPVAIAVELILDGKLPLTGCHIPTHRAVYEPVLAKLRENGIAFKEDIRVL
jgi:saccharopine dehydrogenase-like NADP-dependent oxidoreductase